MLFRSKRSRDPDWRRLPSAARGWPASAGLSRVDRRASAPGPVPAETEVAIAGCPEAQGSQPWTARGDRGHRSHPAPHRARFAIARIGWGARRRPARAQSGRTDAWPLPQADRSAVRVGVPSPQPLVAATLQTDRPAKSPPAEEQPGGSRMVWRRLCGDAGRSHRRSAAHHFQNFLEIGRAHV